MTVRLRMRATAELEVTTSSAAARARAESEPATTGEPPTPSSSRATDTPSMAERPAILSNRCTMASCSTTAEICVRSETRCWGAGTEGADEGRCIVMARRALDPPRLANRTREGAAGVAMILLLLQAEEEEAVRANSVGAIDSNGGWSSSTREEGSGRQWMWQC